MNLERLKNSNGAGVSWAGAIVLVQKQGSPQDLGPCSSIVSAVGSPGRDLREKRQDPCSEGLVWVPPVGSCKRGSWRDGQV